MADNKQHDTRTARRPDCVTEIRMGNSVLVVSGYFKKDTTTTAADKMARVLEAEAAAQNEEIFNDVLFIHDNILCACFVFGRHKQIKRRIDISNNHAVT